MCYKPPIASAAAMIFNLNDDIPHGVSVANCGNLHGSAYVLWYRPAEPILNWFQDSNQVGLTQDR